MQSSTFKTLESHCKDPMHRIDHNCCMMQLVAWCIAPAAVHWRGLRLSKRRPSVL